MILKILVLRATISRGQVSGNRSRVPQTGVLRPVWFSAEKI